MAGESTKLFKEWHVFSQCWTSLSSFIRNSPDVRSIVLYELCSLTDEIARNEWKTTILKSPCVAWCAYNACVHRTLSQSLRLPHGRLIRVTSHFCLSLLLPSPITPRSTFATSVLCTMDTMLIKHLSMLIIIFVIFY